MFLTMNLKASDPLAVEVHRVINGGDLETLQKMLEAHPGLAAGRLEGARGGRKRCCMWWLIGPGSSRTDPRS